MIKKLYVFLFLVLPLFSSLSAQQVIDLCLIKKTEFTYTVTSNIPNTVFYWELNGQLLSSQNPVIDWFDYPNGTYLLTVYGIADGCKSNILKYQIIVEGCSSIYIPSSFTPNDDGINDTWYPIGEGWEKIEVMVFNRWGELIFESKDLNGYWDGSYKNTIVVQNDVYVYKVTWKGIKNSQQVFYGKVTLIR
jgi:gliding motility-associated-like protein